MAEKEILVFIVNIMCREKGGENMAFDANEYLKEYRKKNIKMVTLSLHKINDADIIEAIGEKDKSRNIKKLIRKGMKK